MAKKKQGLSLDEHSRLGAELAQIRDRLGEIAVQLGNAYPPAIGDLALRTQEGVDKLRSELDSVVFKEHPALSTKEGAGVYYPQGRHRGQG